MAGGTILRLSIAKPGWSSPQLGQYVFLNFPQIRYHLRLKAPGLADQASMLLTPSGPYRDSRFEWHPYTLASSPLESHYEVDIKQLGMLIRGLTRGLADHRFIC